MKHLTLLIIIFILVACSNDQQHSVNEEKTVNNNRDTETHSITSSLGGELGLEGIRLGSSIHDVEETIGQELHMDEMATDKHPDRFQVIATSEFVLAIEKSKLIGFMTEAEDAHTTAGIVMNDSVDKLVNSYPNYTIYHAMQTYYMFDENYFLLFDAEDMVIKRIGLFARDAYLDAVQMKLEDLIAESEIFH
ncbi:hypothetical protein [Virgibacillus sp. MG-45]|uniref:hypothetical protein n=1 Tax=Virgibacillus sp. MG-45 TaxID=3102791 RepID=UPI002ED78DFE